MARGVDGPENTLAAGILVACATMFPRMLAISGIFNWSLATELFGPIIAMAAVNYLLAGLFWYRSSRYSGSERVRLHNPFELRPALIFAALLAAIMLLSRALSDRFGDAGVYVLAAASGIADVDAITLSLANMAGDTLATPVAGLAILIAAFVNTGIKAGLSLAIGGIRLGSRVGLSILAVIAAGAATWWSTH